MHSPKQLNRSGWGLVLNYWEKTKQNKTWPAWSRSEAPWAQIDLSTPHFHFLLKMKSCLQLLSWKCNTLHLICIQARLYVEAANNKFSNHFEIAGLQHCFFNMHNSNCLEECCFAVKVLVFCRLQDKGKRRQMCTYLATKPKLFDGMSFVISMNQLFNTAPPPLSFLTVTSWLDINLDKAPSGCEYRESLL